MYLHLIEEWSALQCVPTFAPTIESYRTIIYEENQKKFYLGSAPMFIGMLYMQNE